MVDSSDLYEFREPNGEEVHEEPKEDRSITDAAYTFIRSCGLEPTPDAVSQLALAFFPCLRIMIERGYDPNGRTWREGGWRGLLYEIRKKGNRMWHRSWLHGQMDNDSPYDMINYCGMYIRMACQGPGWGEQGEPGDDGVSAVSMGDYSSLTENGGQVGSGQTVTMHVPPRATPEEFKYEIHVMGEDCPGDCPAHPSHDHPANLACQTGCPAFGALPY